ncbi:hypothetical protein ACFL1X_04600 [Candidatus Hydrogenedentota bacterium]
MKKLVAVAAAVGILVILAKNGYLAGDKLTVQQVVDGFKASGFEFSGGSITQGGFAGEVEAAMVTLSGTPVRIMYFDNTGKLATAKSNMDSGPGAQAVGNFVGVTTTLGIQTSQHKNIRRWTYSRQNILLRIETDDPATKNKIIQAFLAM